MRKARDYRSFMADMDPDLKEFFAEETGLVKKKTKKKANKAPKFKVGDSVETDGKYGTIIFGPYEDAFGAEVYEVETEENGIVTASTDKIAEYVPPVEEHNDDDDLL